MKILALNGSHKKMGGVNQAILDRLFIGAKAGGAECETIRLADYNITPCLACNYCQKQSDYSCIYDKKDDFAAIIERMKKADIIIYATPVYIMQMSSRLKLFFDRFYARGKAHEVEFSRSGLFFHDVDREALGKPFVSLIVSDNWEEKTVANLKEYFASFSQFMDAPLVGSLVRKNAFLFKSAERDKNIHQNSEKVMEAVEEAGRELAEMGKISKRMEKKVAANMLPVNPLLLKFAKKSPRGREIILQKVAAFKGDFT